MDRFEPWLETMYFYCSAELYDLDRLKTYLSKNEDKRRFVQKELDAVLVERPFSALDWEARMNIEHESDDDLYGFLSALNNFLFRGGPYPDWD
ncbi:MAG: hypothetical protein N4A70_10890 [Pelagimonas sp.]|jgi:hypothetical protein|nr:hypothetical protein [Pelagimonas sp.]